MFGARISIGENQDQRLVQASAGPGVQSSLSSWSNTASPFRTDVLSRCAYLALIWIVLWPASSWITFRLAPRCANREQKVCLRSCQRNFLTLARRSTFPHQFLLSLSAKTASGADGFGLLAARRLRPRPSALTVRRAFTAFLFRWTTLEVPFLVSLAWPPWSRSLRLPTPDRTAHSLASRSRAPHQARIAGGSCACGAVRSEDHRHPDRKSVV